MTATLREVCSSGGLIQTGPFGSQLHASDYVGHGIPVIMPTNIGENRVVESGIARVSEEMAVSLGRHRLRAGDIVYSRRGDITRRALIRDEVGWLCGTGCLLVRPGSGTDPVWLSYWLGTPDTRRWLQQHAVGATMPNLNTEILGSVPVELPPLDEQRRIAEVLGALDDLMDNNERMVWALGRTADHIFDAFDPIAETKTFAEVVDIFGGGTPSTTSLDYWAGDICWATPTDLTALPSPYLFDTAKRITEAGLAACSSRLHPTGVILMTSRATIGRIAIAQQPTATNQGFIVLGPRREVDRWYLFHELRTRVDEFISRANGSTFLEISRGTFKGLRVAWPSEEDRQRLHARLAPLHEAAISLEVENDQLRRTRDELLPLLMSGAVRVRPEEVAA